MFYIGNLRQKLAIVLGVDGATFLNEVNVQNISDKTENDREPFTS